MCLWDSHPSVQDRQKAKCWDSDAARFYWKFMVASEGIQSIKQLNPTYQFLLRLGEEWDESLKPEVVASREQKKVENEYECKTPSRHTSETSKKNVWHSIPLPFDANKNAAHHHHHHHKFSEISITLAPGSKLICNLLWIPSTCCITPGDHRAIFANACKSPRCRLHFT